MRPLTRVACAAVLAALAAGLLVACNHTTGPSLSVSIEGRTLVPSSTVANKANLCCCRVTGVVKNLSSVAVNVEVRFHAKNASGASLGTALDWITNVAAGGSKSFDAPGIIAVCSQVATVDDDPIAYGLYDMPK